MPVTKHEPKGAQHSTPWKSLTGRQAMRPCCKLAIKPIRLIHPHRCPKKVDANNRRRAICSIVSACTRRRRWPSCRICACLSTIPRPSVTFACSKCSKRCLAASARPEEPKSFAAFALTCLRCANKASICSPPRSTPFLVILSSLLYRCPEELLLFSDTIPNVDQLQRYSLKFSLYLCIRLH